MSPISSKYQRTEKRPASSPSNRPPGGKHTKDTDLRVEVPEHDGKKVVLPVVSPIKENNLDTPSHSRSGLKLDFGSAALQLTRPSRNRWQRTYKKALKQSPAG